MEGTFSADGAGNVTLVEKEGLDFAPVTVQLPGGERVPFLFTAKLLDAKGKAEAFEGSFVVPAYRGSSFLDPKVRGIALPGGGGRDCGRGADTPPLSSVGCRVGRARAVRSLQHRKKKLAMVCTLRMPPYPPRRCCSPPLSCERGTHPAGPRWLDRLRQRRRAARPLRRR